MKKIPPDKILEAAGMAADRPELTNVELAGILGVTEKTIRRWKQRPEWREEQQRLREQKMEAIKGKDEKFRAEYLRELSENRENLKRLMAGHLSITARSLDKISAALKDLSAFPPLEALEMATAAGLDRQWRVCLAATELISNLIDRTYEIGEVRQHLETLLQQED